MLKYSMRPAFWVDDLAREMKELHPEENWDNLRQVMFYDQYMNDVYVNFYFGDPWKYTGEEWEDETRCRMLNYIREYLMSIFPGQEEVLVDVIC